MLWWVWGRPPPQPHPRLSPTALYPGVVCLLALAPTLQECIFAFWGGVKNRPQPDRSSGPLVPNFARVQMTFGPNNVGFVAAVSDPLPGDFCEDCIEGLSLRSCQARRPPHRQHLRYGCKAATGRLRPDSVHLKEIASAGKLRGRTRWMNICRLLFSAS